MMSGIFTDGKKIHRVFPRGFLPPKAGRTNSSREAREAGQMSLKGVTTFAV
jgi:hypothetical protein